MPWIRQKLCLGVYKDLSWDETFLFHKKNLLLRRKKLLSFLSGSIHLAKAGRVFIKKKNSLWLCPILYQFCILSMSFFWLSNVELIFTAPKRIVWQKTLHVWIKMLALSRCTSSSWGGQTLPPAFYQCNFYRKCWGSNISWLSSDFVKNNNHGVEWLLSTKPPFCVLTWHDKEIDVKPYKWLSYWMNLINTKLKHFFIGKRFNKNNLQNHLNSLVFYFRYYITSI